MINRRQFLSALCAGAATAALAGRLGADALPAQRPPNILVIVADDLGYGDLGCQGATDLITPNIDSLARNGVRLTNGYASAPVCSPSRAGLLTGRYQNRFGFETNPIAHDPRSAGFGIPATERTLADELHAAGYATGIVGKWHLGSHEDHRPLHHGFDEFYGFLSGRAPYLPGEPRTIYRNDEPVVENEYLTDAFGREAVSFIDRHRQQPFFLYLSFSAVHNPLQTTEKYLSRFPHIRDPKRRLLAAVISAMDDAVGRVLEALASAGLDDDTLIFFLSDNGGAIEADAAENGPLSGEKNDLREGGIRVPFLVQWKGRIPAGLVDGRPVISLDVFTTSLAAVGAAAPRDRIIDGVDLLPCLTGRTTSPPHEFLFWRYADQHAVRRGNWKLLKLDGKPTALFDLTADPAEMRNQIARNPDTAAQLQQAFDQWNGQLMNPLWPPPPPPVRRIR